MKPVMQTKLKPPRGNCWAACVASVLELPLEDVPDVEFEQMDATPGAPDVLRFWKVWREWLAERGLGLQCVGLSDEHPIPPGILIVTGRSPRGDWQHSVVYKDGVLAHDPHPEGGGVTRVETLDLLYPLNPLVMPALVEAVGAAERVEMILARARQRLGDRFPNWAQACLDQLDEVLPVHELATPNEAPCPPE